MALRFVAQVVFLTATGFALAVLYLNLIANLQRQGIGTDYDYLTRPAGFAISGSGFRSSQPVVDALVVGVRNTFLVSIAGIFLATVIGVLVGIARLSTNWLVSRAASVYVESLRNIPVLVIILFMFTSVTLRLPSITNATEIPGFVLSNRGVWIPWFSSNAHAGAFRWAIIVGFIAAVGVAFWRRRESDRTGRLTHGFIWGLATFVTLVAFSYFALDSPISLSIPSRNQRSVTGGFRLLDTYFALTAALVIYTASHIAEIVRGSILSVDRGQTEAASALGLTSGQRLRHVVLPQAIRVAIPPTANQYLNLTKNSSLAVAIGFAEVTAISQIVISQGNPAPQSIAVLMIIYLVFSLSIAALTNLAARRFALRTR